MSEYSYLILSFISSKSQFFYFSWHIIRLLCRMVTIFLPTQRSKFGGPLKYLEHVRRVDKKLSGGLEKYFSPKNEKEICCLYFKLHFSLIFWAETLFHEALKISCWLYEHVQGSWTVRLILIFNSGKKRDHTTHQSNYRPGKVKKVEILKIRSSKSGWNILTKLGFCA